MVSIRFLGANSMAEKTKTNDPRREEKAKRKVAARFEMLEWDGEYRFNTLKTRGENSIECGEQKNDKLLYANSNFGPNPVTKFVDENGDEVKDKDIKSLYTFVNPGFWSDTLTGHHQWKRSSKKFLQLCVFARKRGETEYPKPPATKEEAEEALSPPAIFVNPGPSNNSAKRVRETDSIDPQEQQIGQQSLLKKNKIGLDSSADEIDWLLKYDQTDVEMEEVPRSELINQARRKWGASPTWEEFSTWKAARIAGLVPSPLQHQGFFMWKSDHVVSTVSVKKLGSQNTERDRNLEKLGFSTEQRQTLREVPRQERGSTKMIGVISFGSIKLQKPEDATLLNCVVKYAGLRMMTLRGKEKLRV